MNECIKVIGSLIIEHFRNNKRIRIDEYKNVVVNTGLAQVAGLIVNLETDYFDYMAIGTGTTEAQATDTALESEITTGGGARAAATITRITQDVTNDTAQFVHQWTFTDSFAITEAGIFNDPSAGVMLSRKTFSAYNVVSGDELQITWRIQFK